MTNSKDSSPIHPMFAARKLRFGAFEVDLQERELRNRGIRVNLQKKPFQILELLLQRPGSLVTRTELEQHLWPDSHVSFGRGLNTAVNTLRQALGDSSAACRFIETRSGLGYRFVASVEEIPETKAGSISRGKECDTPKREAHQDYLRGKYLQNKMTEADLGKSIAHFESAIAQDPRYALAYTGLADTYSLFAFLGMLPSAEARRRAQELTMIALEIDDELAEAHASLAGIRKHFYWDYPGAERAYCRALQLSPDYADGHRWYAAYLSAMGRTAEALNSIRHAQQLDPLSPAINVDAARNHYMNRRFKECINQSWQTLVLEAGFGPAQHMLGLAYEQVGMYDEAITELQNARTCSGENPAVIAALGHTYARCGRQDEAANILCELDELSQQRYVSSYWRSIVYAGLGTNDLAFQSIDKACDERDVRLVWLKVEPRFDPLRSDRRFDRLLKRVGFNTEGLP